MATADPPDAARNLDILVVDDAHAVRRRIRAMLEDRSVDPEKIREAATAREALDHCAEQPPDLVLLDVMLPDIPGEELGAVLLDQNPGTEVVPLTALDPADGRVRKLVAKGALDVVEKPLRERSLEELFGTLREQQRWQPDDGQGAAQA